MCRREPKEQIISRELWDSWSVCLRVKTAVIVRRPAGLQGLVLGRVTRAPKRLQLWRDATELCAAHQTITSHLWYSMNKTEKSSKDSIKKHSQLKTPIIFLQPVLNGYHNATMSISTTVNEHSGIKTFSLMRKDLDPATSPSRCGCAIKLQK